MADWYAAIAAEWKTRALATLTEIDSTRFRTVVQALKENVISEAIKSLAGDTTRVAPPYLFQQLGTDVIPTDVSPGSRMYRLPCKWWYVIDAVTAKNADATLDAPAYCRSRLEVLRLGLQTQTLTTCQWTGEDGVIDSSEDVAFADKNMQLFAAQLSFENGFLTLLT